MSKYDIRDIGYLQIIFAFIILMFILGLEIKFEIFTFAYIANGLHFCYGLVFILISYLMRD